VAGWDCKPASVASGFSPDAGDHFSKRPTRGHRRATW